MYTWKMSATLYTSMYICSGDQWQPWSVDYVAQKRWTTPQTNAALGLAWLQPSNFRYDCQSNPASTEVRIPITNHGRTISVPRSSLRQLLATILLNTEIKWSPLQPSIRPILAHGDSICQRMCLLWSWRPPLTPTWTPFTCNEGAGVQVKGLQFRKGVKFPLTLLGWDWRTQHLRQECVGCVALQKGKGGTSVMGLVL